MEAVGSGPGACRGKSRANLPSHHTMLLKSGMFKVHELQRDNVIDGHFIAGSTNYEFAIDNLVGLMNKLDIQRKIQRASFYKRLEQDIVKGCIMPAITLAFIDENDLTLDSKSDAQNYIISNISAAFILDGIQRLNTLQRVYKNNGEKLDLSRPIYVNVIICKSMDNLLYRMITLNNGQKSMTARHQIEVIADNIFDFDKLDIKIRSEKTNNGLSYKDSFKKEDIIKAYIAFLSDSVNIDNQRIIEEKMDELIADRIIDSSITDDGIEFLDIINIIKKLVVGKANMDWFKLQNNLIGFAVGAKKSYVEISNYSDVEFSNAIDSFEAAFSNLDSSKIRVGQYRRKAVEYFISHIETMADHDVLEITDRISQL